MNFDFLKTCGTEDGVLREMYDSASGKLEQAEWKYWRNPQECGILLRETAEQVCRIYNYYYQVGYPAGASLEEYLCYTDDDAHNAKVSLFLSVLRKEQRDRLNKLRVYGDDCVLGHEAPDEGMAFEDRMAQNARRMMETMTEVLKDMCRRIDKRTDVEDERFSEERLPESYESVFGADPDEEKKKAPEKSWLAKFLGKSGKEK